jgi:hypothetical protein
MQLTRIEHEQQPGLEKKVLELKDQLRNAELDDQPQEKEVQLLKRKGIRESEQLKWEAIREVRLSFVPLFGPEDKRRSSMVKNSCFSRKLPLLSSQRCPACLRLQLTHTRALRLLELLVLPSNVLSTTTRPATSTSRPNLLVPS